MTFNDFMWQVCFATCCRIQLVMCRSHAGCCQVRRPVAIPLSHRLSYGARFLVSLLTMEAVMHFIYVVAIKDAKAWSGDTPFELAMIGFWNLIIMWLKVGLRSLLSSKMRVFWSHAPARCTLAVDTVAFLSIMGTPGWNRPTREYGSMCCK